MSNLDPTHAQPPTSTLAIVSLVSGILGWTLLPMIASIVAIVTGHMARKEIRMANPPMRGDGLAIGGLILGWLSVALMLAGIAFVFVFLGGLAWFASMGTT